MLVDIDPEISIRRANPSDIEILAAIDDDATLLFTEAGLDVDFAPDHAFVVYERRRWSACVAAGTTLLALDERRGPVGFVMLGRLDGEAYVEQLSVKIASMRRGIGTRLLAAASAIAGTAGDRAILLTTYAHLPWNRPFYERNGYVALAEGACGIELRQELKVQRRWLPHPEQRIAMRQSLRDG